ncbi:OTU domain-containing protein 6B [Haplosporangium sp. Z 767]|nr:OTU domain-containing protein 6B [Haplosporangium sp. Z 767]KAF9189722.1 OTU domain-containing protein 6B [Haplosporangium sp. Z 11]
MQPELAPSIEVQPSLTSPTTSTIAPPETLEELKARHKKEQRELTAKVTALKKTATKGDKKKKKEVLIEIAQFEQSLSQQHDKEEKEWLHIHKCDIGSNASSVDIVDKLEEAADGEDDFDLNDASIPIDHLTLDSTPTKTGPLPQQSHGGKKPNRQKARKDRKAQALKELQDQAEMEAAGQVNMNEVERKAIEELAEVMNVTVKEVTADGHCLYNAIADQLTQQYQTEASVKMLRQETAEYMRQHSEDFLPFLTNMRGDMMSTEDFTGYCNELETTAVWGGQPELLALSRVYKVPIWVVQMGSPTIKLSADSYPTKTPLMVSYHRHMYGLGEHYNSLRPKRP